jgi:rubrerythrin
MFSNLKVWLNHFEYHASQPRAVEETAQSELAGHDRRLIARSLATFQLGEQSDGSGFLAAAQRFAAAHAAEPLPSIIELFIREEQRHARLLLEFMGEHGIAPKRRHWTDAVFRRVRRLAGFELYLNVLIAAELIGNVYYRTLESVTECRRLKRLCRTLLADELAHVGFESELILALRSRRSAASQALARTAHRAFFLATSAVVWLTHRELLRRAGYSATGFLRACRAQYAFHLDPPAVCSVRASAATAGRRQN